MDLFYNVLQTEDKVCGFNSFSQLGLGSMIKFVLGFEICPLSLEDD